MLRGGTAWFSALVLLGLALPAGLAGSVLAPDPPPSEDERVTPLFAPTIPPEQPDAVTLDRFEVEPRTDPIVPGTSVAIRAFVETGELREPVELHVEVQHSEGTTHLTPAPQMPVRGGSAFVAAYWDAQGEGPFEVTGTVSIADQTIPLPGETGTVEASSWEDEGQGWVRLVVEGTLLWALVLGGLGFASRWAGGYDDE